ncbi:BnaCnng42750D [Brassica napus]|uniref:BnaCnng42750D protein n=3 Tax=Brassica TaxID=3705 RepID=A0A078JCR7_BRANA|nr:BnaCnng42750D [Brassica napus]VDD26529.1 unnamed protein product [Brassica oleracea]
MGKSFAGDGGEFMVLVQEMINAEVRSYMAEMQRDRNVQMHFGHTHRTEPGWENGVDK